MNELLSYRSVIAVKEKLNKKGEVTFKFLEREIRLSYT
jgi:hypothetical protein